MSILFRTAREADLDGIYTLALESGIGITTLPKNKNILERRLTKAIQSFSKKVTHPHDEYYLFVLEDVKKKQVVGTAAIESFTGRETPFYSYRRTKEVKSHDAFGISVTHEYLSLSFDNQGKSEVCTLYLDPRYRHSGNGLLLSLARFLFMYHFPERFRDSVIAELRGVCLAGTSPFWSAVGQHFFDMPFADADERTISTNKNFIADLIPRHPIYVNVLPDAAQKAVGVADIASQPAMNLLMRQGFAFNETVDIFDAGPTLEAKREKIRIIQEADQFTLNIVRSLNKEPTQRTLLSNASVIFKATFEHASLDLNNQICSVSEIVANLLELNQGDKITISKI